MVSMLCIFVVVAFGLAAGGFLFLADVVIEVSENNKALIKRVKQLTETIEELKIYHER